MIIPIPIPIFMRQKTQEELNREAELQTVKHHMNLRRKLREDMNRFKQKFRNTDIRYSSEAYVLFKSFGHLDIDKLGLRDLFRLGFVSNNICRKDIEDNIN